eukprot:CAMPEP_0116873968 /NCGR_PEP_ID=MMETSP0463-20121206/5328_1 /TAXON_ID=181622 /ORGANISM="Strombidinopsis sp, Strain SopsisLIS2011" /LENGTH=45 /DNA_ID= /DNA_START= /DNA_END= /DNA_ORIENTATION=
MNSSDFKSVGRKTQHQEKLMNSSAMITKETGDNLTGSVSLQDSQD